MKRAKSAKSKPKSTKPKFEILYEEKYFARDVWVPEHLLPNITGLPHLNSECKIHAIEIKASGSCRLDSTELGYQDVRIYVSDKKDDTDDT